MTPTPLPVRGVCFDKDGTLFDFAATWEAWAAAFLARATGGDADRATRIGQSIGFDTATRRFARDSIVIAGTPAEVAAALAPSFPEYSASALLQILDEEAIKAPQVPAVDLSVLLADLVARDLRLGVATNDSEAAAHAHLNTAGVTHRFDFIAGYDSGHGGKPAPGPLLAFASAMALSPGEVVMVGDSLHDLHAGRAAGMRTVGVLTGAAERATLTPHADVVLDDIGGLPGWLDTLAAPDG